MKEAGFEGFCSVDDLRKNLSGIPVEQGVYIVYMMAMEYLSSWKAEADEKRR